MRYAVFTDIHANLEALEAVLAKIDEISREKPIDELWFLGDLVGYGPNPNECIIKLRERTNVIIAGNHDWAAVGKIDLEDFSAAARISAEWTAEQLTEEHRDFLINLPERIETDECTLVHGSPYGPLWEYLTSEVLAERSFQYFRTRYCFVGHTHVPVIFQQPDTIANTPTLPLEKEAHNETVSPNVLEIHEQDDFDVDDDDDETTELQAIRLVVPTAKASISSDNAFTETEAAQGVATKTTDYKRETEAQSNTKQEDVATDNKVSTQDINTAEQRVDAEGANIPPAAETTTETHGSQEETDEITDAEDVGGDFYAEQQKEITSEEVIISAEDRLNNEIEELLALLGLSQSMVQVTNEMLVPPEGAWQAKDENRAIINPGGVGQPRDGDPRAAFMIFDTEAGFTFYRIPYAYEKTQEKIIEVGLPHYLATRLTYGR
jgi:diadenosine tetraphosphatase ApaH/serine/threonine PP2A family protein phosphatase